MKTQVLSLVSALVIVHQLVCPGQTTQPAKEDNWLEQRFTRAHRHGNYTTDPAKLNRFQPSGIGTIVYQLGDVAILHNRGLYWSNEENPDDDKDMLSSVVAFRKNKRIFAARGYRFDTFRLKQADEQVTFDLWTGTMGDDQIIRFTLDVSDDALDVSREFSSTKHGKRNQALTSRGTD